jgi:hypothetical protein
MSRPILVGLDGGAFTPPSELLVKITYTTPRLVILHAC